MPAISAGPALLANTGPAPLMARMVRNGTEPDREVIVDLVTDGRTRLLASLREASPRGAGSMSQVLKMPREHPNPMALAYAGLPGHNLAVWTATPKPYQRLVLRRTGGLFSGKITMQAALPEQCKEEEASPHWARRLGSSMSGVAMAEEAAWHIPGCGPRICEAQRLRNGVVTLTV
ncbi:hypothetical protein GQ53DRAFT_811110 [Thozetella sp. PMI_491]|nr:hypothetical protein GQ53DRAFT_811110 [Thozetella sp. PMI_491]